MEIVLAVLLLFGGFALGSATSDKRDDIEQSSMRASPTQDVSGPVHHATPYMRECLSDRSGVYRDLTVPYSGRNDRSVFEADTCEGECPDE